MSGDASAPLRGEVWWVDLNPTQGAEINKIRPCVVIGADPINQVRSTIVVIPCTSSPKPRPPLVVSLPSVPKNQSNGTSVAIDQIRAIDKSRLKKYLGVLSSNDLASLENALRQVLGLL